MYMDMCIYIYIYTYKYINIVIYLSISPSLTISIYIYIIIYVHNVYSTASVLDLQRMRCKEPAAFQREVGIRQTLAMFLPRDSAQDLCGPESMASIRCLILDSGVEYFRQSVPSLAFELNLELLFVYFKIARLAGGWTTFVADYVPDQRGDANVVEHLSTV